MLYEGINSFKTCETDVFYLVEIVAFINKDRLLLMAKHFNAT